MPNYQYIFTMRDPADPRTIARAGPEALTRQNRLILESAGEGIFGIDREGRLTFVNPAACRLLGRSEAELVHLRGHGFELVDLRRGKTVGGRFVPVGAAHGMKQESRVLAALAPVRTGRTPFTAHASRPRRKKTTKKRTKKKFKKAGVFPPFLHAC